MRLSLCVAIPNKPQVTTECGGNKQINKCMSRHFLLLLHLTAAFRILGKPAHGEDHCHLALISTPPAQKVQAGFLQEFSPLSFGLCIDNSSLAFRKRWLGWIVSHATCSQLQFNYNLWVALVVRGHYPKPMPWPYYGTCTHLSCTNGQSDTKRLFRRPFPSCASECCSLISPRLCLCTDIIICFPHLREKWQHKLLPN